MATGPKLKWEPSKNFPGEYECYVGCFAFSVATAGQWEIATLSVGGHRMIIINCGDAKSLTAAKRKCQQWLDRQWRAMVKLKEEQQ